VPNKNSGLLQVNILKINTKKCKRKMNKLNERKNNNGTIIIQRKYILKRNRILVEN
jgi:hypothetical protein